jgi:hypothetical protein
MALADQMSWPCADCGVETRPFEMYMVTDEVWCEAGDEPGFLCVGCLEDRLHRPLGPVDFLPIPANDDDEKDTIRLRACKGSGRNTYALYGFAIEAIACGTAPEQVAERLGLDLGMLEIWLSNRMRLGLLSRVRWLVLANWRPSHHLTTARHLMTSTFHRSETEHE